MSHSQQYGWKLVYQEKKKIIIATFYREWQQPNQSDQYSKTVQAQLERWCNFLTKWEVALVEGKEVMGMGDIKLDFLKMNKD